MAPKQYIVTEPYLDLACKLGEGPHWDEQASTLRFVDIKGKQVHSVDLTAGPASHKVAELDISFGTTADIDGTQDKFAFGGKHGYGVFDKRSKTYEYIERVWTADEVAAGKEEALRANDGAVDTHGRYWLGFCNDVDDDSQFKAEGVLFRLDADRSLHRMLEGVTIPNGLSWSPDNKLFYFTDSVIGIDVFDFDEASGAIANRRPFYRSPDGGAPDGHCQDEHGNLWIALVGLGKVVQVSPAGETLAEILLPARLPTCPVICGHEMYITSIHEEDSEWQYAGSVFRCDIGVGPRRENRFKLS